MKNSRLLDIFIQEIERGAWRLQIPLKFTLHAQQGLVLQGANGAGKTSVLLALAGLLPYKGEAKKRPLAEKIRLKLMGLDGLEETTVYEHLKFWQVIYNASSSTLFTRMAHYDLDSCATLKLSQLSQGWANRVGLARLGLGDAEVWLLDEPFASLDKKGQILLAQDLQQARDQGKAIVMACHTNPLSWPALKIEKDKEENP